MHFIKRKAENITLAQKKDINSLMFTRNKIYIPF